MIESYPLIEQSVRGAINNAQRLAMGQSGPARREEGIQIFDQWVRILRQTSELPRSDRESRIIIARATTHLGYVRAILSMVKGGPSGRCEPELLAQATEDYRKSIALFEGLLAESPGDAKLRRYLADAVGVFGMGCCFRFAYRNGEAESCYRRAIQLRRDLVRGTGSVGARRQSKRRRGRRGQQLLLPDQHDADACLDAGGFAPTGGNRGPAPPTGG